jgi:hypothetical protein
MYYNNESTSQAFALSSPLRLALDRVKFKVPEKTIQHAIDSLYRTHPEYVVPEKWESKTELWMKNYSFLKTVIFYFHNDPEEMYYVTFVKAGTGGNLNHTRLAVRAVQTEETKTTWKNHEELSTEEQKRIQKRFVDEIVSKLETIIEEKVPNMAQ